jgi:hypothetical protein
MKCKSLVKFIPARKKGSGTAYQKAIRIYPKYQISSGWFTPESDMIECDGDIKVLIEASMEGECQCSSYAELKIKYKCNKCGGDYYPELPQNSREISYLVEVFLEKLPEYQRDRMIDQKVNKEVEIQKEAERWRKESQGRFQKLTKELSKPKKKK